METRTFYFRILSTFQQFNAYDHLLLSCSSHDHAIAVVVTLDALLKNHV